MAKLKVFSGISFTQGKSFRCVVAATTKKEACSILDVRMNELNSYWSQTGNKEEVEAAINKPGIIVARPLDHAKGKPFIPLSDIQNNGYNL